MLCQDVNPNILCKGNPILSLCQAKILIKIRDMMYRMRYSINTENVCCNRVAKSVHFHKSYTKLFTCCEKSAANSREPTACPSMSRFNTVNIMISLPLSFHLS